MAWKTAFSKGALKDIKNFEIKELKKVLSAICDLQQNPWEGKPLQGSKFKNTRSIRVGDYRVLYLINEEEEEILILVAKHRREVYK